MAGSPPEEIFARSPTRPVLFFCPKNCRYGMYITCHNTQVCSPTVRKTFRRVRTVFTISRIVMGDNFRLQSHALLYKTYNERRIPYILCTNNC